MDTLLKTELAFIFTNEEAITRLAWQELMPRQDPWTYNVHRVLFVQILGNTTLCRKVVKAITSLIETNEDCYMTKFEGMLAGALRGVLPKTLFREMTADQRKSAIVLCAQILVSIMVDEDILLVDMKTVMMDDGTFHSKPTIVLNGVRNERDYHDGWEAEPGLFKNMDVGTMKPSKTIKEVAKALSSCGYVLDERVSEEYAHKFHTLKSDWNKKVDKNGNTLQWNRAFKKAYYKKLAGIAADMVGNVFYPTWHPDHRGRWYTDNHKIECVNILGKSVETLQYNSALFHPLNEDVKPYLAQQLYSAVAGKRCPLAKAEGLVKAKKYYKPVSQKDILAAKDYDEMADLVIRQKVLKSLHRLENGLGDDQLYGIDFTFSGGIFAGLLFKSPEFLTAGNVYGYKAVTDAHARFLKLFGVDGFTRKAAKDLQMGLLHGAHISSLVKDLLEAGYEFTEEEVMERMEHVYGPAIHNINMIAEWGKALSCSEYNEMRWTMPDNVVAAHFAYQEGVPLEHYVVSAKHKGNVAHRVMQVNLPYATMRNNPKEALYGKVVTVGKTDYETVTHLRGLYADIIHSFDAYAARRIVMAVRATGMPILIKHDNFYVHASSMQLVKDTAKAVFNELLEGNYLQKVLEEIAENSPSRSARAPKLFYGEAENKISDSENFLMP